MDARTYRVGVIRVVTQDQARTDMHGSILQHHFPFEVVSRCIDNQPEGVHDGETKRVAIPKILTLAQEFAEEGVDGIIVSCADDPGVEEARGFLDIPVIGAGESTASAALRFGERIFVLGITEHVPEAYARILGERLAGDAMPKGVHTTLDLLTDEGRQSTIACARELASAKADAIALACTGMATIGIAPVLQRATGLPVLDPVLCEGAALYLDLLHRTDQAR